MHPTPSSPAAAEPAPLDQAELDQIDGGPRPVWQALAKGVRKRCPRCGEGAVLSGYLKVAPDCNRCGQRFEGHRADDLPPYLTMFLVGHLLIVPVVEMKRLLDPPLALQVALWPTLGLIMTLWLLPITKAATIALQWSQRMHGFSGQQRADETDGTPSGDGIDHPAQP